jgi:hypothetical protein
LNEDGALNIIDVVLIVDCILDASEYISIADVNDDGQINVVDIVTLVNLILS